MERDINHIPHENSSKQLTADECSKLDGIRVKIADVKWVSDVSRYKDGLELPVGQEIQVEKVELQSYPFGTNIIGRDVVCSTKYNLKQNQDGNWTVNLHEKSSTKKFLTKYKLDKIVDAKDIEVVLIAQVKGDYNYMTISI